MKLSIIIPVYNEGKTVEEILKKVINEKIPGVEKEIIVVDDGSTDETREKLNKLQSKSFKTILQDKNQGKGAAVLAGIKNSTGEYIIIQDADLEYDPKFIRQLIKPILEKKSKVVYGTRIKRLPRLAGEEKTFRFLLHYFGNRFLSLVTSILYGQWITDMETCYKLFPKVALNGVRMNAKGFEFEPEITAKLLKRGYKIMELPIEVKPRGYEEGKKISAVKDGSKAIWYLFKYRFTD
ncbi:MAG: glycosyl transferase [Candidatus Levybacteria bacterium RIFCSPLOWO2_01_FULL_36_13]|nr:MAG: glycosyl transferase [Candidatus Levybacteria bacterium RIFCSPHIGHO2_01_FULL_36_15b]OGH35671.1 MAG: glycosyl transferase [Candidatus Levybacteria bacterium RIFCSPLOWO2_01_FULL_36_13]